MRKSRQLAAGRLPPCCSRQRRFYWRLYILCSGDEVPSRLACAHSMRAASLWPGNSPAAPASTLSIELGGTTKPDWAAGWATEISTLAWRLMLGLLDLAPISVAGGHEAGGNMDWRLHIGQTLSRRKSIAQNILWRMDCGWWIQPLASIGLLVNLNAPPARLPYLAPLPVKRRIQRIGSHL